MAGDVGKDIEKGQFLRKERVERTYNTCYVLWMIVLIIFSLNFLLQSIFRFFNVLLTSQKHLIMYQVWEIGFEDFQGSDRVAIKICLVDIFWSV
jgi:hypothetical protein